MRNRENYLIFVLIGTLINYLVFLFIGILIDQETEAAVFNKLINYDYICTKYLIITVLSLKGR